MSVSLLTVAAFAADAHRKQNRKGINEPYINHPIRVARMAEDVGLSPDAIHAALLHDVIEDCGKKIEDLLNIGCTGRTVAYVSALTKWWDEREDPNVVLRVHKPLYYAKIADNPETLNLKLLDRVDNLRDMMKIFHTHSGWACAYYEKTQQEFPALLAMTENTAVKALFVRTFDEVGRLVAKVRK